MKHNFHHVFETINFSIINIETNNSKNIKIFQFENILPCNKIY